MLKNRNKEWFNKKEILDIYPIGETTYKKRIKKLLDPTYSGSTRFVKKPLEKSNLKEINVREIHKSVLHEIFGNTRFPNGDDTNALLKWVNNTNWDWIGNVVPSKILSYELIAKMHLLFVQLKKLVKPNKGLILYYAIELNTKDNYYHSHFLIKEGVKPLNKKILLSALTLIAEENNSAERRIDIQKYNYETFENRGKSYSFKCIHYGYDILR
jgi:hypothetical protein